MHSVRSFETLLRRLGTALALLAATTAAGETHALLVGVSRYGTPTISDLAGPANDLAAMETLVKRLGTKDLVSLRDAAVSRSSVELALQQMGRRTRPGDWVLFYYSGHGAQALASQHSDVDGDYDQFVPLPGFDPADPKPEAYILDKDFYAWIKRYLPFDVPIVMVVDSCHSGSMQRRIDPRAYSFTARVTLQQTADRAVKLIDRPGPRLEALRTDGQPLTTAVTREDLPNLIYIGASRDDQLALETELPQEGDPQRGVLTFALEQGLNYAGANETSPAADLDDDGILTVSELSAYIDGQVRLLSAQRQQSSILFPSGWGDRRLFSGFPPPRPASEISLPRIMIVDPENHLPAPASDVPWRQAGASSEADFIWIFDAGDVVRRSGDLVATKVKTFDQFAGVLEKWQTLLTLRPLVSERAVRLVIEPSGADYVYPQNSIVSVKLNRTKSIANATYATVFNIASDGTIQLLYPLAPDGAGEIDRDISSVLETRIVDPYGVDHIIAVTTPNPPVELRSVLQNADGHRQYGNLAAVIRATLKRASGKASLSIAELYTDQ